VAGGTGTQLPDLLIAGMGVQLESGSSCDYASTALGLRVRIENQGDGAAGPFFVEANASQQIAVAGLAAGADISLWFSSYGYTGANTAVADATHLVEERDETNNAVTTLLPIPTLPPRCTPTPSPTPTVGLPPAETPAFKPSPPTTTPLGPRVQIKEVFFDGTISSQEPDEYVEITNLGSEAQELEGWTLLDISDGLPVFQFPAWSLAPGGSVRVYTNEVHPETGGFSFGRGTTVWNNCSPDTAALLNKAGERVSQFTYSPGSDCR
jgi:hypothetical protein